MRKEQEWLSVSPRTTIKGRPPKKCKRSTPTKRTRQQPKPQAQEPTGPKDPEAWIDEHTAAAELNISHRTLQKYRVTGDGPKFARLGASTRGGSIRYKRKFLDEWAM